DTTEDAGVGPPTRARDFEVLPREGPPYYRRAIPYDQDSATRTSTEKTDGWLLREPNSWSSGKKSKITGSVRFSRRARIPRLVLLYPDSHCVIAPAAPTASVSKRCSATLG